MRRAGNDSQLQPGKVVPFGNGAVGIFTAHPVGLIVAIGILAIGLEALPEARYFFAGVVLLGAVFGFFLWLRHR